MKLPCGHVMALRKKLNEPVYDESLCDVQWTVNYYRSTQRLFIDNSKNSSVVVTATKDHKRKLSQHEKFRKASLLTTEIASIASCASNVHYNRRIKLLQNLLYHWKNGEEVTLMEIDGQ